MCIVDLVRLRHLTRKYTANPPFWVARYYTIQCSGVHYLLRSLYCKQKVDESQQSGSSQLELNNILSAHDSKENLNLWRQPHKVYSLAPHCRCCHRNHLTECVILCVLQIGTPSKAIDLQRGAKGLASKTSDNKNNPQATPKHLLIIREKVDECTHGSDHLPVTTSMI